MSQACLNNEILIKVLNTKAQVSFPDWQYSASSILCSAMCVEEISLENKEASYLVLYTAPFDWY